MLEAVNSVLSNAPLLKASQESSVKSASQVERSDYVTVKSANYSSRNVELDIGSPRPILEIRDVSTGASLKRFPTEGQIRAYTQAQSAAAGQSAESQGKIEPSAAELDVQVAQTPDIQKPEAVDASVSVGGTVSERI